MNKSQFIEAISLRIGEKHSTTLSYVNAALSIISETVKNGDVVVLDDFGKFYLKKISKKTVKKANSDEQVQVIVPEHTKVSFTPYRNIMIFSDKYRS